MKSSSPGERGSEPTSRYTSLRRGCCMACASVSSPLSSRSPTGEWSCVIFSMRPRLIRYRRESPTCPIVTTLSSMTAAVSTQAMPFQSGLVCAASKMALLASVMASRCIESSQSCIH